MYSLSETNGHFVSTHSRPKAAGLDIRRDGASSWAFQLTAARRRLGSVWGLMKPIMVFQLTAARRRLALQCAFLGSYFQKFQLTAARRRLGLASIAGVAI